MEEEINGADREGAFVGLESDGLRAHAGEVLLADQTGIEIDEASKKIKTVQIVEDGQKKFVGQSFEIHRVE